MYAGPLANPPFENRSGDLVGSVFNHRNSSSPLPSATFSCFLPEISNESRVVFVMLASMFDLKL
jgi:hypothetical protein